MSRHLKYKRITPLRALDLFQEATYALGREQEKGRTGEVPAWGALIAVRDALGNHVRAALVRGRK